MSGLEAAFAETLAEHRFNKGRGLCNCGAELGGGDRMAEWRAHVAAVLVASPAVKAHEAAVLESACTEYERTDDTVPDVMEWFRNRAAAVRAAATENVQP